MTPAKPRSPSTAAAARHPADFAADPDDPEALAREVVEAMRATGPVSPELERAILGGARRFASVETKQPAVEPAADE